MGKHSQESKHKYQKSRRQRKRKERSIIARKLKGAEVNKNSSVDLFATDTSEEVEIETVESSSLFGTSSIIPTVDGWDPFASADLSFIASNDSFNPFDTFQSGLSSRNTSQGPRRF